MTKRQGLLLALVLASGSTLLTYIWYTGKNPTPVAAKSTTPAPEGQPVSTNAAVVPPTAAGYAVPKHKRAVAIIVDASRGAGGLVQGSDHIDILLTATDASQHRLAETIIQDVPVLGPSPSVLSGQSGPSEGKRQIVVSVTPHDAQRLMVAQLKGALVVTLRNPTDHEYAFLQPIVGAPAPRPAPQPVSVAARLAPPRPTPVTTAARRSRPTPRPVSMASHAIPPEPVASLPLFTPPVASSAPEVRQVAIPAPPRSVEPAKNLKSIEVVRGTSVETVTVKD